MKPFRWSALCLVSMLAIVAVGCQPKAKPSTTPEPTPAPQEATPAQPETPPVAEPFPRQPVDSTAMTEPTIDEWNRQGVLKTVYFAYDSNEIDDAARAILQANAAWLTTHKTLNVEIGGHCDERGSIGYNVALGDRRAAAVKSYLTDLGANAAKLVAVSYGEERPADPGHDESAYAKNRRAEFLIKP